MSKELPYFKFHPSEWITGDINDETYDIQGQFISICAYYWQRNCDVTITKLYQKYHKSKVKALLNRDLITESEGKVSIEFLDEQYAELLESHDKRVEAGRRGGQANVKQPLSNA